MSKRLSHPFDIAGRNLRLYIILVGTANGSGLFSAN